MQDRVAGTLLGMACGDALGAPYEFQPPRGPELDVVMQGGGVWEVGEWTDDSSMAIVIAEVAVAHDLRTPAAQDQIVQRWIDWARTAKDVGVQTSSVLYVAERDGGTAEAAREAAFKWNRKKMSQTGEDSSGNGSLMRTAPVALAFLDDERAMVDAARRISALTHCAENAVDACVLWCCAIRHAVLTGEIDVRVGLKHLIDARQAMWRSRLIMAERNSPAFFSNNGWVVEALLAAWSAISRSPNDFTVAIDAAVRCGFDTDTVAAIAGALLGAAHGASSIPSEWVDKLHGWPGMDAVDLAQLAQKVAG